MFYNYLLQTIVELGFSPGCYLEVSSLSNQQLTLTANDPGTVLMVSNIIAILEGDPVGS